jgi:hypothetical protein
MEYLSGRRTVPAIDLKQFIPDDADVIFSSLKMVERRSDIDRPVAAIALANGKAVDVEWDNDKRAYVVSLYSAGYQIVELQSDVSSPAEVLQLIGMWSRQHSFPGQFATQSSSNTSGYGYCVVLTANVDSPIIGRTDSGMRRLAVR